MSRSSDKAGTFSCNTPTIHRALAGMYTPSFNHPNMKSSNDRHFLLFVTMGLILLLAGIAASLEAKFALAGLYFVAGPLLIVGAAVLFPQVEEPVLLTLEQLDATIDMLAEEQLRLQNEQLYVGANGTCYTGPKGLTPIEVDIWAEYHKAQLQASTEDEDYFVGTMADSLDRSYERQHEQHVHPHEERCCELIDDHDWDNHRAA